MLAFFVELALTAGLMTVAARLAESKNRSGAGWAVLVLVLGVLGAVLGAAVFGTLLDSDDGMGPGVVVAAFAPVGGHLTAMLATLAWLSSLPAHVLDLGDRFPVYRPASKDREGVDGVLALTAEGLRFEPAGDRAAALVIPYPQIELAVPDGEAVRIAWREPEGEPPAAPLVVLPTHGPDNRDWRVRQSTLLARRISEQRAARR